MMYGIMYTSGVIIVIRRSVYRNFCLVSIQHITRSEINPRRDFGEYSLPTSFNLFPEKAASR